MKNLIKQILREETKGELNNRARYLLDVMRTASLKNLADGDIESMRKALKDVEESGINWDKDVVKSIKNDYDQLMVRAKSIIGGVDKPLKYKLKTLRNYIKILNKEYSDSDIIVRYFLIIHNFLIIENLYSDEIERVGKGLNKYLSLPDTNDISVIENLFKVYYDNYSKVRFSVETLDSIDEVRNFFNRNPNIFTKLLKFNLKK